MPSFNDFRKTYFGDDEIQSRYAAASRLGRIPRTEVDDDDYTLDVDDVLVAFITLTAGRTLTLPLAATMVGSGPNNKVNSFIIKDESGDAATYNITIQPSGGETIDGNASASITNDYGALTFYTDGIAWFSLSNNL